MATNAEVLPGEVRTPGERRGSGPIDLNSEEAEMTNLGSVLIVEDEAQTAEVLELYLRRAGFSVRWAADGETGLQLAREHDPDLVILDLLLPGRDGRSVCRELRAAGETPILMLTALGGEVDRCDGLELGADDYVTKPFSPRELVCRVQAILRRSGRAAGRAEFDGLLLDADTHSVHVDGKKRALSPTEFRILGLLLRRPGRVYRRQDLIDSALGPHFDGDPRAIDAHVTRLRRKLGRDGFTWIRTVFGVGYQLCRRSEQKR